MESFNKTTKKKYIDRAIQHKEADEIIQGFYWQDGEGCCVGCLAHANDGPHEALEEQTGIPEWLSRVADRIHEGLPEGEYQKWPQQFIESMPTNLSHEKFEKKVKAPFLVFVLKSMLDTFDHKEFPDIKKAVDGSIALWERDDIGSKEWAAARAATWDAAWTAWAAGTARDAAWAATWDAAWTAWAAGTARDAAWAAWAAWAAGAAGTARDAAWAAWAAWAAGAAGSAAGAAAYIKFRDELIRLLIEAGK